MVQCNLSTPQRRTLGVTSMITNHIKPLLFALAAIATPLQAAELDPSHVPAAARWLIHADFDAMRSSITGMAVFAVIESNHGAQLQAFKRMSSIHPLNDLHGVTLMGDGKNHEVALFAGEFDRGHVEDIVKAAPGYSAEPYDDVTIHTWQDHGGTQHAAFANEGLLVFSRQEITIKHELDVLKGTEPAMLMPSMPDAPGQTLVVAGANLADIPLPADVSDTLGLAKTLRIMATENAGRFTVQMRADTVDADHADRLRRLADGLLALGENADERLASPEFQHAISVAADGPAVDAKMSLPIGTWLGILHDFAEKHARK